MSMFAPFQCWNTPKVSPFDELFDGVTMCHCCLAQSWVAQSQSWSGAHQWHCFTMFLFLMLLLSLMALWLPLLTLLCLLPFQFIVLKTQIQPSVNWTKRLLSHHWKWSNDKLKQSRVLQTTSLLMLTVVLDDKLKSELSCCCCVFFVFLGSPTATFLTGISLTFIQPMFTESWWF